MEIEQSHIQHSTPHVNILKNLTNKTANVSQGTPTSKKRSTLERGTAKRCVKLLKFHAHGYVCERGRGNFPLVLGSNGSYLIEFLSMDYESSEMMVASRVA